MTPALRPRLVNGRFGDPAVLVERMHGREALLFDCGDLAALSARHLLKIGFVYVSHMHMDHFIGLDALVRISLGRERDLTLVGPAGLIDKLHHRLQGYEWDLADRYDADFRITALELAADGSPADAARFRFRSGFAREAAEVPPAIPCLPGLTAEARVLEHHGPSVGYSIQERAHANVWRNRVAEMGLAAGPWLNSLKSAILDGVSDEHPIEVAGKRMKVGELRHLVTISAGQKLTYVTDVADTPRNRAAIADLARGADLLFLEARFAAAEHAQAEERAHLTTRAAGEIARSAAVRRLEPFHFSARYGLEEEDRLVGEALGWFTGEPL